MVAYLDCNATTPVDPAVREVFLHYLDIEFGNAGSRTHEFGLIAKQAVQKARSQVAAIVDVSASEVLFTSGATESNNLAILGLRDFGLAAGKRHIVTTAIEHKAVLEPCQELENVGFEVTYLKPDQNGVIDANQVAEAVRDETLLVTVMHVNNETGAIQPISEIADALATRAAFLHVDAAQGFGKEIDQLTHPGIDLISVSGHKIYAPKGVGALIWKRKDQRAPLKPIMFGGGQEFGLRPGTIPVPLVAALGEAAAQAQARVGERRQRCAEIRENLLGALNGIEFKLNTPLQQSVASTLNISFKGLDSEAVMLALKGVAAISNGSACTSTSYQASHVLKAMGLENSQVEEACRISWSHLTDEPDWQLFADRIRNLL